MTRGSSLRGLAIELFERSVRSTVTLHFGRDADTPTFVVELDGGLHWRMVELLYTGLDFVDDGSIAEGEPGTGEGVRRHGFLDNMVSDLKEGLAHRALVQAALSK